MLTQMVPIVPTLPGRCDFCFVPGQPLTSYPCRRFETCLVQRGGVVLVRTCVCCPSDYRPEPQDRIVARHISLDAWGACPACAALLDRGALDRLGRRMVAAQLEHDVPLAHRPLVARHLRAILRAFWRHRLPLN